MDVELPPLAREGVRVALARGCDGLRLDAGEALLEGLAREHDAVAERDDLDLPDASGSVWHEAGV